MSATNRLILVGGGHAHLEVLRAAARRPFDAEIVLVSLSPMQLYSGMMPGQLRGAWSESALAIDLPRLCTTSGVRFVEGAVSRVDAARDSVSVRVGSEEIEGSLASVDIGASVTGLDLPGVREHAHLTRPATAWRALVSRLSELGASPGSASAPSCCVVGGGAAGVELALAIDARLRSVGGVVTLITALPSVPAGFDAGAVSLVSKVLEQRRIAVLTNAAVAELTTSEVVLADGRRIPSQLTVWATGAAAPSLLRESALPLDGDGYLAVDDTLRAETGIALWGAGDCIAMRSAPWMTKSGVYAVRAAPILAHNLRVACAHNGGTARRFVPQRETMFILDTADDRALLYSQWLTTHARWALAFKQYIDKRFVARYQQ